MIDFTEKEISIFKKLNTPTKVQDFLNKILINHELDGVDTVKSPVRVIRENNAHCIEGAILGAYILSLHGYKPLILHLQTTKNDFEHVITPFQDKSGLWGALSKTNHYILRYRDPVYKSIRELVMSYFHEYATDSGMKTLRSYSRPLNLNYFGKSWVNSKEDLWQIDEKLGEIKHFDIAPKEVLMKLRRTDNIERQSLKTVEWEA